MSVTFRPVTVTDNVVRDAFPGGVDMNLANVNAALLLESLGIEVDEDGLVGTLSIPEARRAIIRARNLQPLLRPASDTKPPGRARVIDQGVDVERMAGYLDRFERLVEHATNGGAQYIGWD